MEVISLKIEKKVKDRMKKLAHVNWSEVIRQAIARKITEEDEKNRTLDTALLLEAASITDKIRKTTKGWSAVEEIRRWREARK